MSPPQCLVQWHERSSDAYVGADDYLENGFVVTAVGGQPLLIDNSTEVGDFKSKNKSQSEERPKD